MQSTGCPWMPKVARVVNDPAIDPDSDIPLYEQMAAILRAQITARKLRRVPSILTLSQEYSISRGTAHRAVKILQAEGLVRSSPGRGVFAVPQQQEQDQ